MKFLAATGKEAAVFGALAAVGIGRIALRLARRFILTTAKRIGIELLRQSGPELLDVVSSRKSPEQALKNTISNTVKKQTVRSRLRQQRKTIRSLSKKITKKNINQTKFGHFKTKSLKQKSV